MGNIKDEANKMSPFIGRNKQKILFKQLIKKNSASLVVIKGRRRIGKSRLAEEFGQFFPEVLMFSGLPPDKKITAEDQRKEFQRQLRAQRVPGLGTDDWGDLFKDLGVFAASKKILILLDEITWMGDLDETFLGKLKIAWDLYFKTNPKLVLIISGSNSAYYFRF